MLNQADLTEALHSALKACTPACGRFCVAGAEIKDERYVLHHNGAGERSTDVQTVHLPAVLGLSKDGLAAKLRGWIEGLHKGEHLDLNAAIEIETSGPALAGWPWQVSETPTVEITVRNPTVREAMELAGWKTGRRTAEIINELLDAANRPTGGTLP